MTESAQLKQELRNELIARRKSVLPPEREVKDKRILERITPLLKSPVLCYVSTEFEVSTELIIRYCRDNKMTVAVPVVDKRDMRFYFLNSAVELSDYEGGVCIVPALAFNGDNFRLGYGGGYYDRFLRDYKGVSIGLCYREFITDIPVEEHDVKIDVVITD